jgi:hypothetical protein
MTLRRMFTVVLCLGALLLAAAPVRAQDFRGRINGTVSDNTGAVLPGVTVTVTSPALIQPQVQVTGAEGDYRFIALPPGVYEVTFELPGFQTIKRDGIRVVINQTLSVDQQMQVATLQETVTVTGESPVVDTSTNTVGTNFTKELLTEIPNARDIWAAMAQAPGLQMTGYDVGGSRTGTQTGFLAYGFGDQATTKLEGINTTEGTSGNAGYFDFGSFEEFQVGGAGNDASADVGGAYLNITVKSGGDKFSGSWYTDWEGDSTISDNVPDAFRVANQRDEDGYFTSNALERGNPIDRQYDINANLGGPIYRRKAWFFYSYRLNDQYKSILGSDQLARSKLSNTYTLKGTFQVTQNNQIIAYANKRAKLQDLRDFGPTTPVSAATYQNSQNYPSKVEWTSVLGSKAFLDVLVGQWYNFFPLRPTDEAGVFDGPVVPGRIDLANNQRTGYNNTYQDRKRYKPQFTASLAYFKDGWQGGHDFKVGYEWKRDRRKEGRDQPFDLFYRDNNGLANQIDIYNTPNTGITDVVNHSAYLNDTWKYNSRLTFNLGVRMDHYIDGWPEQEFTPNGHPMLSTWTDPVYRAFVASRTVPETTVLTSTTFAPRLGFAYDLTGSNRTVVKGYYGRFYFNSADTLANQENPVGAAQQRYQFLDQNGNMLLDGPQELGRLLSTQGGAGLVRVDRDIKRPYTQEFSGHLEHEVVSGLSGRVSYVYKNVRNEWDEVDLNRINAYTIPVTVPDQGPDGITGTGDDALVQLMDRAANVPQDRTYTNPVGPAYDSNFHTMEVALNRRMAGRWMALTSFGYSWLNQFHDILQSTNALNAAGIGKEYNWQPNQRLFGDQGRETSTIWNFKFVGRYLLPYEIGLSGSYKVQSGRNWGRTIAPTLPGAGTEVVRIEPIDANRAPTVDILDVRVDKAFKVGRFGNLTAMVDVFNLTNRNTVTNFRITTGSTFKEVLAILDPRIVRFGVRFDF